MTGGAQGRLRMHDTRRAPRRTYQSTSLSDSTTSGPPSRAGVVGRDAGRGGRRGPARPPTRGECVIRGKGRTGHQWRKSGLLLVIKCLISLYKFSEVSLFRITQWSDVSGNPPLLLIITAQPLLAASKLVLPKGSSHLEQTTEILTFFKIFNTLYESNQSITGSNDKD